MKMQSVNVQQVRVSDETRLARWLERQTRCYARFSLVDLREWLSTHDGFVAEQPDGVLLGLILMAGVTRDHASIIGLAVGDRSDEEEILFALFRHALPHLRDRGINQLTCITNSEWTATALPKYLGFRFAGNLANYLKVDWGIPDFGNRSVYVSAALPDDTDQILSVDRVSFPEFWQQEEHILVSILNEGGYLFKAEWKRLIVGYTSGVWGNGRGHINRLAVHPQLQRLGIGTRLLAESISFLHKAGASRITLNTQVENTASRRLYERFGFRLIDCDTQILTRSLDEPETPSAVPAPQM